MQVDALNPQSIWYIYTTSTRYIIDSVPRVNVKRTDVPPAWAVPDDELDGFHEMPGVQDYELVQSLLVEVHDIGRIVEPVKLPKKIQNEERQKERCVREDGGNHYLGARVASLRPLEKAPPLPLHKWLYLTRMVGTPGNSPEYFGCVSRIR